MSKHVCDFLRSCAAGVLHEVGVALRAAATQRVPWTNMYEFATTSTVIVMLLFLLISIRRRELRALGTFVRSEEHTSELQSRGHLVCRLLLEKKKSLQLLS